MIEPSSAIQLQQLGHDIELTMPLRELTERDHIKKHSSITHKQFLSPCYRSHVISNKSFHVEIACYCDDSTGMVMMTFWDFWRHVAVWSLLSDITVFLPPTLKLSSQSCPWVCSTCRLGWVEIYYILVGWVGLGWVVGLDLARHVLCMSTSSVQSERDLLGIRLQTLDPDCLLVKSNPSKWFAGSCVLASYVTEDCITVYI